MNALEKLTQINKLMENKGFHLVPISDNNYGEETELDTLEDIANGFERSNEPLDFGDLCFAKDFGGHALFVHIGRTEELYRYGWLDGYPFMASHLKVSRAWFSLFGHINIFNCDYMKDINIETINGYVNKAKKCCASVDKALRKISSHYDYWG